MALQFQILGHLIRSAAKALRVTAKVQREHLLQSQSRRDTCQFDGMCLARSIPSSNNYIRTKWIQRVRRCHKLDGGLVRRGEYLPAPVSTGLGRRSQETKEVVRPEPKIAA